MKYLIKVYNTFGSSQHILDDDDIDIIDALFNGFIDCEEISEEELKELEISKDGEGLVIGSEIRSK